MIAACDNYNDDGEENWCWLVTGNGLMVMKMTNDDVDDMTNNDNEKQMETSE